MAYLEMWRSKPAWDKAPAQERDRLLEQLQQLVAEHAERHDGTAGPFLSCDDMGCVLIWDVKTEDGPRLKREYEELLGRHFAPVMFGVTRDLTARDYADRMPGSGDRS